MAVTCRGDMVLLCPTTMHIDEICCCVQDQALLPVPILCHKSWHDDMVHHIVVYNIVDLVFRLSTNQSSPTEILDTQALSTKGKALFAFPLHPKPSRRSRTIQ